MKKFIKLGMNQKGRCVFCLLMAFFFCLLFRVKDITYEEAIAPDNGGVLELRPGAELTQTWLSNQKKIHGIRLVFDRLPEFNGYISFDLIDRKSGNVIRNAKTELSCISDGILDFSFDVLKIESTEDYVFRFVMSPMNNETMGCVYLKVNGNYNGLSIDHVKQNCGLSSSVLYVKSNPFFTMFFFPGSILVLTFCLMLLTKREFTDVLGVVVMFFGLFLYVCGLIFNIEVGARVIEIITVIGFFFLLYNVAVGKWKLGKYFSFSVLVVIGFYIFAVIYNYNTILVEADEYLHWALAPKDMFYSNKLAFHEGSTVFCNRYPPFMALIQYYFMYINQAFSVRLLYIAYQFSGFCFLIVCMSGGSACRRMGIFRQVLIAVVLVVFPLVLYPRYYNLIMIDGFLGVLFSYTLYCFFFDELNKFNVVRITMALSALVLTKEMGVVLAGLACACFMTYRMLEKGRTGFRDQLKVIGMGGSALGMFVGWQLYCQVNISYSHVGVSTSAAQMLLNGSEGLTESGKLHYAMWVFYHGILKLFTNIKVGPFYYVLFLCILMFIAYCLGKYRDQRSYFIAAITLCVGNLFYFGCIMILYVLVFSSTEALNSASLDRYMFSYLLGMVYLLMCCFLYVDSKALGCMLCIMLYLAPVSSMLALNQTEEKKQNLIWGYDEIDANIRSFAQKGDRIFYWCDDSRLMSYRIFRFYICPMLPQEIEEGCTFRYVDEGGRSQTFDLEQIGSILSHYDYVYIANYTEEAKGEYLKLFEKETDMRTGGFYQVETKDDEIILHAIGYSPIKRFY